MAVIRVEKTKNYTIMGNYHLNDRDLSLKAKGLMSVMLSLPDDWDYSINGLVAICKENETSIKSALNELKDYGYLVVTKKLPNETVTGRIEYEYILHEQKQGVEKQEVEKQGVEILGVEKQGVENHTQLNTNISITKKQNTNILKTNIYTVFDYWNSKNIIKHQKLTPIIEKQITKAIKEYGVDNVKEYIDRYAKILQDNTYYFDTKWTLTEFLKQSNGISTFTDEGSKWLNYNNRNSKCKSSGSKVPYNNSGYTDEELEEMERSGRMYGLCID